MFASGTGLLCSNRFEIVQGIPHQSAAPAGEQQHRVTVDRACRHVREVSTGEIIPYVGCFRRMKGNGKDTTGNSFGTPNRQSQNAFRCVRMHQGADDLCSGRTVSRQKPVRISRTGLESRQ
jgi:hypothetical protein